MIIESLIAHVVSYFYFQPSSSSGNQPRPMSQALHFIWGMLFTTIILNGLSDGRDYFMLRWLVIVLGVLVSYIVYENKLKRPFNFFLNSTLTTEQSLHIFYKKNRSLVQFALHQLFYSFWLIILNEVVTASDSLLVLAGIGAVFLLLLSVSLYALNKQTTDYSLTWTRVLKHTSVYIVMSALSLFIIQLFLEGLRLVEQTTQPVNSYVVQSPYRVLISSLFILLLLMKPANLIIRAISSKYDPKKETALASQTEQDSGFKGAGAMIGNLERLLILLSFFFGSLLSVVAILSIKAFARYKLIAEDPYFSEYFVIGTMLSVLITFACYALLVLLLV